MEQSRRTENSSLDSLEEAINKMEQGITPEEQQREPEAVPPKNEGKPEKTPDEIASEEFDRQWEDAENKLREEKESVQEEEPDPEPEPEPEGNEEVEDFNPLDDDLPLLGDLDEDSAKEDPAKEGEEEAEAEPEGVEDLKLPTDSPKYKERLDRALERGLDKRKKELDELQKEVERLNGELQRAKEEPEGKQSEATEEERKELLMLRRRYQAETDPEIEEKFNSRIKATNEEVKSILESYFSNPDDKKTLEDMGAFDDFTKFAMGQPKAFGQVLDVIKKASPVDGSFLESAVATNRTISRQRDVYLKEISKDAEQYFAKQKEEQLKTVQQQQALREKNEKIAEEFYKTLKEDDKGLFKPVPIPPTATEKERAYLKAKNEAKKRGEQYFAQALKAKDIGDFLQVAHDAASIPQYVNKIKSLAARVKELEDRDKQRKEVGRTHSRSRSHGSQAPDTSSRKTDLSKMSIDEAFDAYERDPSIIKR